MRKNTRLGVALVAAAALALTGCAAQTDGDDTGGPVELTYWTWVPGVADAVEAWNDANPETQVVLEQILPGAGGGYQQIFQALTAGNAPCLANIEHHQLPAFVAEGGVLDITQHGADQYRELFTDWLWERNQFDGALYGIPNSSGPLALFYRSDVFDRLGLAAPATWDDFRAAAVAITGDDAETFIGTFPANGAWFAGLAEQAGAQWFSIDGEEWVVDIDGADTLEVADYWQGMLDDGLVKTIPFTNDAWYADVQAGNIVGWIGPNWGAALLEGNVPDEAGNWRVAELPQWEAGANVSGNWGGSATAVLTGCEHPERAVEFAAWLQSDPDSIQPLLAGGSGWPAAKDLSEVPAASVENAYFGDQNVNELFGLVNQTISTEWRWGPTAPATFDVINDGFQAAFNGDSTLAAALADAQEQTVKDLRDKGLGVVD